MSDTNLQSGQITFVQHYLPALLSGEYSLKVDQTIKTKVINHTYSGTEQKFFVRGERFRLQPNEVKIRFPAPNSQGDFDDVLPHVVLTKTVLPWEWDLSGGAQVPDPKGDVHTWLALLVFDRDDPAPTLTVGTLNDLISPGSGITSYPITSSTLFPGEAASDPVKYIDIPATLFNEVAPSQADLYHLAHSRSVSPAKKTSNPENVHQEYSVIVANRLPRGEKTSVYLVCLEGMGQYLPGGSNTLSTGTIRLASLANWEFTSVEDPLNFATTLNHVNQDGVTTLQLPTTTDMNITVAKAFKMGYTALNHQTRLGDQTVSWYRGPLLPVDASKSGRLPACVRNADALLRYNPEHGMFDVSYAAAWQLGRLLALNNKEFALDLYRWKHANQTASVHQAMQASENTAFDNIVQQVTQADALHSQFAASPPALSDSMQTWLGRLSLLYGVPFNYLVPDERMLSAESLRFFQVDLAWLDCLIDGAYSIGRSTESAFSHDQALLSHVLANARQGAYTVRAKWLKEAGVPPTTSASGTGPISGFLLNSAVVNAYPGLEVEGYGQTDPKSDSDPLPILRFERLSPEILLCLFAGTVAQVRLHPPSEGLHFGVPSNGIKPLRYANGTEDANTTVSVSFRSGDKNVVDISTLAEAMQSKLSGTFTTFTAAEFALEMTEGVEEVIFHS